MRSSVVVLALGLAGCASRPVCPAADLECLAASFSIVDFDYFDQPEHRDALVLVDSAKLAAVPAAPSGELVVENAAGADGALTFDAPDDGAVLVMLWTDRLGCRPSFCFSHCPRGVRCAGASRCTPARNDGVQHASTIHWVEYASTPAQTTPMDLSIVPVSAPGCTADVDALLAAGVAGPPIVVPVNLPGEEGDGGDGGDGPCPDGIQGSTLNCTPLGNGGAADRCISRAEFEGTTGLPLPAMCAEAGTTGCMDTMQGTIVKPCCPGLTCAVGNACGGGSVVGGKCISR